MFCALFAKLGVPIPTQITPKVLAQAKALVDGTPTEAKFSVIEEGVIYNGNIGKQVTYKYYAGFFMLLALAYAVRFSHDIHY